MTSTSPRKTSLWAEHEKLKARFAPFAGYDMPIQYSGVIDEHLAVRSGAGIFDVSHMGVATIEGKEAKKFLNYALTRDLSLLENARAAYSLLCFENGGTVDDLIAYAETQEKFFLVLNASNKEKDFAYLQTINADFKVSLREHFSEYALLALQGPRASGILERLGANVDLQKSFSFVPATVAGVDVRLAVTGYTGERGCEIFVGNDAAPGLWQAILAQGAKPCGLAARDTLRTEMGYSLYGHELNEDINPVEAGLSWAIGWKKENFRGRAALAAAKARPARKLVCLKNSSRRAPRPEMVVRDATGRAVGKITSGTFAPSLGCAIGMALVASSAEAPFAVDIRGEWVPFDLTTRPFYKPEKIKPE